MSNPDADFVYKKTSLDRLLIEAIPCPYCFDFHKLERPQENEDTFYGYLTCKIVGQVRISFEQIKRFGSKEVLRCVF